MIRRHLVAEMRGKTGDEEDRKSEDFLLERKKSGVSTQAAFKSFRNMASIFLITTSFIFHHNQSLILFSI